MSDGALSQDEIDALLAGVDSGPGGPAPAGGGSEPDRQALQGFLSSTVAAQSSNLSSMTGATVTITGPQGSFINRDAFLAQLPDTVTAIKVDFSSGFPGEHMFLLPEAAAKSIAGLMTKEENIELDEMAMSVIGEAIGTIVGSQITALTGKTGNKSIANAPPEAANVPKAVAALPGGNFFVAAYQLNLGDGQNNQFWEILGPAVAGDIARALNPAPSLGGMDLSALGGAMGGGGMPGMNNMMGMSPVGQPANVQSVQFPSLVSRPTAQEAGNIGLIMDVFMEMTVELGRTRKLIKEILGMGEGTIIELDKLAGEPVDILVNHKLIAKGEVVVIDENFGVRVTEIVSPMERMTEMG
ncbi:flagellar motor switch protein FliN [Spirochaetia bacterium]|nr:flagellar motor switch protein FliN [Spirochaetia bacterium]